MTHSSQTNGGPCFKIKNDELIKKRLLGNDLFLIFDFYIFTIHLAMEAQIVSVESIRCKSLGKHQSEYHVVLTDPASAPAATYSTSILQNYQFPIFLQNRKMVCLPAMACNVQQNWEVSTQQSYHAVQVWLGRSFSKM